MQDLRDIEDNLRVIRKLMERGQRYEAITGRGSLLAGALAVVGGLALSRAFGDGRVLGDSVSWFVLSWAGVAIACAAWVIVRALLGADHDEGRRLSAQARAVGRSVLPAYVAAVAFTLALLERGPGGASLLPGAWMLMHGVAILSTSYHAPPRLRALGWTFVVAGVVAALMLFGPVRLAHLNLVMALGFGGLHLAYGLFSLLRPLPAEE